MVRRICRDLEPPRTVSHRFWVAFNFLVFEGLDVNDPVDDPAMLRQATVRSHDQFNTTIYSYSDRYRGIYNDRMVLLINTDDRKDRGLAQQAKITLETIATDGIVRKVAGLTLVGYPLPLGAVAGYYPELNPLLPLNYHDAISRTPAAKSIPVKIRLP